MSLPERADSIATVSLSGRLDEKLHAIAAAGFEAAEIFENDLLSYTGSARAVGALMRQLGLRCSVFQPFRDFEGMPEPARQRTFERAERKFDVCQELGTDLLLVCSNVSPTSLPDRSRMIEDLQALGERAAARGLRIGYEALAWGRHIFDHRDAWAIVRAVKHPAVGLVLDSFHSLARQIPIESLGEIEPSRIFLVQIADAPALSMDPLSWSRHFRCMPGQGDLPIVDYVTRLRQSGFDGPLSLEIFNDRFRAGSAQAVALDGKRSLLLLHEQVSARLAPRGPRLLAPAVRCSGVEFIEFCASEEEAPYLAEQLRVLGFRPAGRHRSKAVERWRQGAINFVINCETEGFAHSFQVRHGASVCAVGLRVGEVSSAMQRAAQLRIDSYSQAIGPGELYIPAVRGVGGSLLYFIGERQADAVWHTEFPHPATHDEPAWLTHIDYLSQAMPYEEMLSWLLYYLALFEVTKTPQVEIADPLGLVLSQAVQSTDGRFRVTLNGSAATQTLASRFLHTYMGAGVQHIALACGDILASAERLRALGLQVLPIPDNYYADLAARFDLDERTLSRLQEFNILSDRDADGEFFHFFSRAFAKRFFFEIVQRKGYAAYAAGNMAIRLAAQSRYRDEPPALPSLSGP